MNPQYQAIEKCIHDLSLRPSVNKNVLKLFQDRLKSDRRLVRDEGISSHFCAFFTPVFRRDNKIFIGHHIKSDSWLSPGGHIDKDETPIQTVRRECEEELGFTIKTEKIELFSAVYFPIKNRPGCTDHFDFWYLIYFESQIPFIYERKEFHDAGWFTIEEALKKKSLPEFRNELGQLSSIMSL